MRLNLAEVALCLGCTEDRILWEHLGNSALITQVGPYSIFSPAETDEVNDISWLSTPWGPVCATGAAVDSRLVQPGNIFFCIKGEHTDGHEHALQAAKAGAYAIVAEKNPFWGMSVTDIGDITLPPVFIVKNTVAALNALAKAHRDTSLAKVIGITGTAGKTSVKEVLAQVLAMRGETAKNNKNLNNQIGLPLSMLSAPADAAFWVLEAGISEAHDMDQLGSVLRPDDALILNAGTGHTQGLGDKGVAHYKSQLFNYIQPGGVGFVCEDYPDLLAEASARIEAKLSIGIRLRLFSSKNAHSQCYAHYIGKLHGTSKGNYSVTHEGKTFEVEAPFIGSYGAENVAAIVSVAKHMGLRSAEIQEGFALATLPEQRFNCHTHNNFTIIDDSYNANPLSAERMLESASIVAKEENKLLILVLGEMKELGEHTEAAHEDLGKQIVDSGAKIVFWKGDRLSNLRNGLATAGYNGELYPVHTGKEFAAALQGLNLTSGVILFKGSRSNHLEELLDIFYQSSLPIKEANAL